MSIMMVVRCMMEKKNIKVCEICGEEFESEEDLNRHILTVGLVY